MLTIDDGRRILQDGDDSPFAGMVRRELASAREKHPGCQRSLHEGYAVLLEEVDELWDQVKLRKEMRSNDAIVKELVQIAAMAQRTAEDLGLVSMG